MADHYQLTAWIAQTFGLAGFFVSFLVVLAYGFWPRNRSVFTRAAQAPLRED